MIFGSELVRSHLILRRWRNRYCDFGCCLQELSLGVRFKRSMLCQRMMANFSAAAITARGFWSTEEGYNGPGNTGGMSS